MDNYNKFILIPKLSEKQFIVKTTAYKNQNAVVLNMLKIKGNSIFFLQIIFVGDYGFFSYCFGICINWKRFHITNIFFNRCRAFLLQLYIFSKIINNICRWNSSFQCSYLRVSVNYIVPEKYENKIVVLKGCGMLPWTERHCKYDFLYLPLHYLWINNIKARNEK